jgi:hypothetical protein
MSFAFFNDGLSNQINLAAENELTKNIDGLQRDLADLIEAHTVTVNQLAETRQQVADLIRYINELNHILEN